MTDLGQLEQIYQEYEQTLSQAAANASLFRGTFGLGDDPRKDACNQIFYEKVGQWVAAYLQSGPTAQRTAQAARWILEYPAQHRGSDTYWMAYAAQKHVLGLIPLMEPVEAEKIREEFTKLYPQRDQLPVQKELLRALEDKAGKQQTLVGRSLVKIWLPRVILLLLGLTIAHLGVTLFLLANLGSDPFNVMIQGLQRLTPELTHGTVHIGVSLLIILVLLVVDRSYVRIGTFLCMVLGGPIIDLFSLILGGAVNEASPMAMRVIAVIVGCGILAFGMTIVIKSQAGTGSNDLVAVVLSDKTKWRFGPVRVGVDLMFALVGAALGGVVGVGTLICMAVVGPVAQVFMPYSEKLCSRFLNCQ